MKKIKKILKNNSFFIVIFTLALIKGFLWFGVIPILQAPDVERHYSTIQWRAEPKETIQENNGKGSGCDMRDYTTCNFSPQYSQFLKLTEFEEARFNINNHQTFSSQSKIGPNEKTIQESNLNPHFETLPPTTVDYPPFYYETGSWIYSIFSDNNLLTKTFAIRFYSLFLGMLILVFAYKIGKVLNFSNTSSALLMGITAFQPMLSFMSIAINVDVALILGITMFLYFSLSTIRHSLNRNNVIGLIIASLLAIFSKPAGAIVLAFFPILALFHIPTIRQMTIRQTLVAIFSLFVLLIILIKNSIFQMFTNLPKPEVSYWQSLTDYLGYHFTFWDQYKFFGSYWGWFGWLDHPMGKYVYLFIFLLILIALIGFIWFLFSKNQFNKKSYIFLLITVIIFHLGILFYEFRMFIGSEQGFGLQGRYFLPTIAASIPIYTKGFVFLFRKTNPKMVLGALFFLMVFLNFLAIFAYIIPGFYL